MAPTYRNPEWGIVQLSIAVSESVVISFCLLYTLYIYKTWNPTKRNNALSKTFKLMNLLGIISFLLCSISQCINVYYWNVYWWTFSTIQIISWYFNAFFWSFGQFMSYLLCLNRIKTTFTNSAYEPKKFVLYYIYSLLILYELTWIIKTITPIIFWKDIIKNTSFSQNILYKIQFYLTIPIIILDVMITLSMSYIFVSRLFKMILMQTRMRMESFEANSIDGPSYLRQSLILTNQNLTFIEICAKITILSVTSLFSSCVFISLNAIAYYQNFAGPLDKVRAIWLQIDTAISCICLLLFLPKTQWIYNKLCCIGKKITARFMKKGLHQTVAKDFIDD